MKLFFCNRSDARRVPECSGDRTGRWGSKKAVPKWGRRFIAAIGLFVLRFAQNVVEFAGSLVFVELLVESVHHLHGYIHRGVAYEYGVLWRCSG